jgi:aminoglycoside 6'-N-acetyltransferase
LVTFEPVTPAHLPLLRTWLESPHAREWWGEPDEELALIYSDDDDFEPYIAAVDGEPVAYIQSWMPSKHPDLPWQHRMTPTTRGIDVTIGDPNLLGKGLGSMIVKQFAAKLFAEGATRLIIDPDITNTRAVAAYTKAGFKPYATYVTAEGADLLMELQKNEFEVR